MLGLADTFVKPGTHILHELTEAYNGAVYSRNIGRNAILGDEDVYLEAHSTATMQTEIFEEKYDSKGIVTNERERAKRVIWYVEKGKKRVVIQEIYEKQ